MTQVSSEITAFIDSVQNCLEQCELMLESESEKRKALLSADEHKLEQVLQIQQANYMKLENLEHKRAQAQELAGFENLKAEEILKVIDDDKEKERFRGIIAKLNETILNIKEQNKISMDIAEKNLMMIDRLKPAVKAPIRTTYSRKAAAGSFAARNNSFEKKI